MRVGVHFNYQNFGDWERFEAHGRGEPATSDARIYDEELHLAGLVEPLGYDSYWAIDHHFSPYIMTGGAIQHLTYMAGKTSRIDFGTMVIVLPWYDPVVVAEQVCVLDNLLQGRQLTLGLGRGAAKREFDAYRVPMGESRDRFADALEVLKKAIRNEWFAHEGPFYQVPETTIRPRPRNPEALLDRMRVAWTSTETLPITANAGLGMLMTNQKSWEEYGEDVRGFNSIRVSKGWEPVQPTVVANIACFESEAEAWQVMVDHITEAQVSVQKHYLWGDVERIRNTKGYEQYAKFGELVNRKSPRELGEHAALPQAWGTPDQVYEKIVDIQRQTGAEEMVLNVRFGAMPVETAERSMRLFAKEVLPRVHELEATLPEAMTGR